MRLIVYFMIIFTIYSHNGQLDKNGGHFDRKEDSYHLHIGSDRTNEIKSFKAKVIKVSDGDTITVEFDDRKLKIRLFGIDSPELKQDYGIEARKFLKETIVDREVEVEIIDRDRYKRIIAKLYIGSEDINLLMVEEGMAWWYEYYSPEEKGLEEAHKEAIKLNKGLWKGNNPIAPWEYRRKN